MNDLLAALTLSGSDILTFAGIILTGLMALGGVVYTQRTTRRLKTEGDDKQLESVKHQAEAEAYSRARESYEAAIRVHVEEQARLVKRVAECERRADMAERRANRAEHRVDLLEDVLRSEGHPIPPEEAEFPR